MEQKITQPSVKQPGIKGLITLLYMGAVVTAIMSVLAIVAVIGKLFVMWTGSTTGVENIMSIIGAGSLYLDTVLFAIIAVGMAVASFFLYRQVTHEVAKQPEYVKTTAYAFLTNALVAFFIFALALAVLELVSIMISSLVLIGTGTDIGALYLGVFLPLIVCAGIFTFAGYMALHIMRGRNKSSLMTVVLMAIAGAVLIATLITVPIKAHGSSSSMSEYERSMRQILNGNY